MVNPLGGPLTERDYHKLETESWIPKNIADEAGIFRVNSRQGADVVGRKDNSDYSGIVFPYHLPGESQIREYRLRRDNPDLERQSDGTTKEKAKYLSPPGRGSMLYFAPDASPEMLADINLPIIICEGAKKCLALSRLSRHQAEQAQFLPIGISGVWNWRGTLGREAGADGTRATIKGPIADLDRIEWKNRKVYILVDHESNTETARKVRKAWRELAKELEGRGATVFIPAPPAIEGYGKTGIDDYLAHAEGGPENALKLIASAPRFKPATIVEILDDSGLTDLTEQSSSDDVLNGLQNLTEAMKRADPLLFASVRGEAIKCLKGIRIEGATRRVDAALKSAPKEAQQSVDSGQGSEAIFEEIIPWESPVDGAALLDDITAILKKFIKLVPHAAEAIALWIIFTWSIAAFSVAPLLALLSPTKRCGKTRQLSLLDVLVCRPLTVSNITAAPLFRALEQYSPTLLIDEADTFLNGNDDLRGILNAGHTRPTAYVMRCVGDDQKLRKFRVFAAKAIAKIGGLPDTLEDRAISIPMMRKAKTETLPKLNHDRLLTEFLELRRKAQRWTDDNMDLLKNAEPSFPEGLSDRAEDNWTPLLSIAAVAGGEWPEKARNAARELSGEGTQEAVNSAQEQLLADIKQIFEDRKESGSPDHMKIHSEALCKELIEIEGRPWAEWKHGRPITKYQLARQLKAFNIKTKQVWVNGNNLNGYEAEFFEEAWERYLPVQGGIKTLEGLELNEINNLEQENETLGQQALEFQKSDVNDSKQRDLEGLEFSKREDPDSLKKPDEHAPTNSSSSSEQPTERPKWRQELSERLQAIKQEVDAEKETIDV